MENIVLNNGTQVIIGSKRDIVDTIYSNCSSELSKLVDSILSNAIREKESTEEWAESEVRNYELSLENKTTLLYDTAESLEELLKYMETAKRIDRTMLTEKIRSIQKSIMSEL